MFFRMIFGLPGAALVTALLFVAMAWMVRQEAQLAPPVEAPVLSILPTIEDTIIDTKRRIDRTPTEPPPVIDIKRPPKSTPDGGDIDVRPIDPTGVVTPIDPIARSTPTVRIAPAYPENCRARGAQGVVIVEFDVTAEGAVVNPRIVSSADSCFDSTVLRSVSKWKYAPKTDDMGRPVAQRGVREFFNFQLTE